MAVHKLILDDFVDDEYYMLIAIHCAIDGYRIAYLLNSKLGIKLKRTDIDIDAYSNKTSFSVFKWYDNSQQITWSLISNVCRKETEVNNSEQSLFSKDQKTIKTFHLIPEKKQVNFFLKIEIEQNQNKEKRIIDAIHSIPQIATAYTIDLSLLKSKDNLIFN